MQTAPIPNLVLDKSTGTALFSEKRQLLKVTVMAYTAFTHMDISKSNYLIICTRTQTQEGVKDLLQM